MTAAFNTFGEWIGPRDTLAGAHFYGCRSQVGSVEQEQDRRRLPPQEDVHTSTTSQAEARLGVIRNES